MSDPFDNSDFLPIERIDLSLQSIAKSLVRLVDVLEHQVLRQISQKLCKEQFSCDSDIMVPDEKPVVSSPPHQEEQLPNSSTAGEQLQNSSTELLPSEDSKICDICYWYGPSYNCPNCNIPTRAQILDVTVFPIDKPTTDEPKPSLIYVSEPEAVIAPTVDEPVAPVCEPEAVTAPVNETVAPVCEPEAVIAPTVDEKVAPVCEPEAVIAPTVDEPVEPVCEPEAVIAPTVDEPVAPVCKSEPVIAPVNESEPVTAHVDEPVATVCESEEPVAVITHVGEAPLPIIQVSTDVILSEASLNVEKSNDEKMQSSNKDEVSKMSLPKTEVLKTWSPPSLPQHMQNLMFRRQKRS